MEVSTPRDDWYDIGLSGTRFVKIVKGVKRVAQAALKEFRNSTQRGS